MRGFTRSICTAAAVVLGAAGLAGAQAKANLPYDHIHVNEPGEEGSQWWETHFGGTRITEAPNRIMYGSTRLMFLSPRSQGGSEGSVIEQLGFSVPDIEAKIRELQAANTKVIEPIKDVPGLYKTAVVEDPWGIRIQREPFVEAVSSFDRRTVG